MDDTDTMLCVPVISTGDNIMKAIEREQARALRREGQSIKEICRALGVSKSSVSVWVRDIVLTEAQIQILQERKAVKTGQSNGGRTNRAKFLRLRQEYQLEGRVKAREGDPLHLAGCMLYWAEGRKSRNRLELGNSDADMLLFYILFLRRSLRVQDDSMHLSITCYTNNGITLEEIESYWLNLLNLPRTCLRKSQVNLQPKSSNQLGRKLMYGVCSICVESTQLVQHVLGAIQEYTGIDKPEWLL
jgi:transcriptional regulator with XRE-family HTH domain